jgi:hypothetical protein
MNARSTTDVRVPPLDLPAEDAGSQGRLGHVPALPGLRFRAATLVELENTPAGSLSPRTGS